jgi:putative two-component system response regulator
MRLAERTGLPEPGSVLVVEDTATTRDLLTSVLEREGYRVTCAYDGGPVPQLVREQHPDLVLMDVLMPHVDGFEACAALKSDPATRLTPVVLITGLDDLESRVRGIEAGADDFLTKPFNLAELRARVRSLVRIKRYTDDLDSAEAAIISLALAIEARDPLTNGHCQRLAKYAEQLGSAIGLGGEDLTSLARGGFLHDIGKVGIPDVVLLKPGPLTADEFRTMQQHTIIGDRVCGELRSLRKVRTIVRSHHERLDGSGYPDGLRGDDIPLIAQITGIVDVFDALTFARPYRAALTAEQAFRELRHEADRGWRSPKLVETWIALEPEVAR